MQYSFLFVISLLHLVRFNIAVENVSKIEISRENSNETERSFYVMGGTVAAKNFPFIVSLQYFSKLFHFCAGSIISSRHVLTAAHCFCPGPYYKPKENILIEAGANILYSDLKQYYTVEKTICHPGYDNKYQYHDIGILVASREFRFTKAVHHIPMHSSPAPPEKEVTILGWGSSKQDGPGTNILHYIQVPTYSNVTCLKLLDKVYLAPYFKEWNICTYDYNHKTCALDSGGPVLYGGGLLGIVSWSDGCKKGVADVHTSVAHHKNWIRYMIRETFLTT